MHLETSTTTTVAASSTSASFSTPVIYTSTSIIHPPLTSTSPAAVNTEGVTTPQLDVWMTSASDTRSTAKMSVTVPAAQTPPPAMNALSLRMPMAVGAFNASVQDLFKTAIATAASLDTTAVTIVSVNEENWIRRQVKIRIDLEVFPLKIGCR